MRGRKLLLQSSQLIWEAANFFSFKRKGCNLLLLPPSTRGCNLLLSSGLSMKMPLISFHPVRYMRGEESLYVREGVIDLSLQQPLHIWGAKRPRPSMFSHYTGFLFLSLRGPTYLLPLVRPYVRTIIICNTVCRFRLNHVSTIPCFFCLVVDRCFGPPLPC